MADRLELETEFPDAEVQTDKDVAKLLPCGQCGTELIVSQFYAAANAKCSSCKGTVAGPGTGGVVVPGKTEPAAAKNLEDALINRGFARALCPAHPDDPDHVMVIVSVVHNPHYGPSVFCGYKNGKPTYKQSAPGESCQHQCQACRATVGYSTVAQSLYRPINKPRGAPDFGRRPSYTYETMVGTIREEPKG